MLADKLPDRIGGRPVDTGFRKWLRIAKLLQAPLLPEEMQAILFYNLFGGIPAQEGAEKLMDEILRFYLCGKSPAPSVGLPKEQLLDWEKDADAIWADFMIYARMDLNKADLHWWEFMALFGSLPKEKAGWVCTVCGYVHEGAEPREVCPWCKMGQDKFERI